ncbi:MAG: hypothetical protein EPN60_06300 [Nevskiaceae bacterium]|nr:MAG: hypothetical protein EPO48_04385 [Nevskiaceae bacterium]TAM29251.1 MAG: hypothetical protein EPN60_06300 [Nevskiaceae bacterium]
MPLPPARVLLPATLSVGYPLLSHLATSLGSPGLQWLALMAIVGVPLSGGLLRGSALAWAWLGGLALLLWLLVHSGGGQYGLFLPPLVLPGAMAAGFGLSLRAGRTPLITLVAETRGPLPPYLRSYTRRLTWFWTGFTASLALVALLLCLSGQLQLWSWFANVFSYVLIGLVLVVEYLLRRHWFPAYAHPGFVAYLRMIVRGPPRASR